MYQISADDINHSIEVEATPIDPDDGYHGVAKAETASIKADPIIKKQLDGNLVQNGAKFPLKLDIHNSKGSGMTPKTNNRTSLPSGDDVTVAVTKDDVRVMRPNANATGLEVIWVSKFSAEGPLVVLHPLDCLKLTLVQHPSHFQPKFAMTTQGVNHMMRTPNRSANRNNQHGSFNAESVVTVSNPVDESNGFSIDLLALTSGQRDLIALTVRCFQAKSQIEKTSSYERTVNMNMGGSTVGNASVEDLVNIHCLQEELALARSIIESLRKEKTLAVNEKKALEIELSDTIASFQATVQAMADREQDNIGTQPKKSIHSDENSSRGSNVSTSQNNINMNKNISSSTLSTSNQQSSNNLKHNSSTAPLSSSAFMSPSGSGLQQPPSNYQQQLSSTATSSSVSALLSQKDETIRRLKQDLRDLGTKLSKYEGVDDELVRCRTDLEEMYLEREAEKRRSQQLVRDVDSMRLKLSDRQQEIARLQTLLDSEKNNVVRMQEDISSSQVFVEELKKQSSNSKDLFERLKQQSSQQIKILEEKLTESHGEKKRLENKLSVVFEEDNAAKQELKNQIGQLETKLAKSLQEFEDLSTQLSQTSQLKITALNQVQMLQQQLVEASTNASDASQLAAISLEIDELRSDVSEKGLKIEKLTAENNTLRTRIRKLASISSASKNTTNYTPPNSGMLIHPPIITTLSENENNLNNSTETIDVNNTSVNTIDQSMAHFHHVQMMY